MKILIALLIIFSYPSDKIKITDPWMRISAKGQTTGLYFKIENNSDKADTLFKVEFEPAGKVEIHETYDAGNDMMGMREVGFIVIPSKSIFELKPGAHHVMLMKLKTDIPKNYQGKVTLHFKQAGKIEIKAEAKEMIKRKMMNTN
ncbi:MAG: copper chaperone PCu(A)C [Ignavibacterium sp.]|jgi:copper(I)-binding protein|nr:copper chaperone PCu(A)C [Ignavibacterium sp.]